MVRGDNDANCTGTVNCYLPSGNFGVLSTTDAKYKPAFMARPGYDFPTGIGTINAANLVNAWPEQLGQRPSRHPLEHPDRCSGGFGHRRDVEMESLLQHELAR